MASEPQGSNKDNVCYAFNLKYFNRSLLRGLKAYFLLQILSGSIVSLTFQDSYQMKGMFQICLMKGYRMRYLMRVLIYVFLCLALFSGQVIQHL